MIPEEHSTAAVTAGKPTSEKEMNSKLLSPDAAATEDQTEANDELLSEVTDAESYSSDGENVSEAEDADHTEDEVYTEDGDDTDAAQDGDVNEQGQDSSQSTAQAAAVAAAVPAEKTPEQLKEERNYRIRRNLRILALAVAAWYFISAGFSWYDEHQAKKAQEAAAQAEAAVSAAATVFADPQTFREKFNAAIDTMRSSLPTANADDGTEGFVAVLSPSIELRGVLKDGTQEIDYLQAQTRYPDALPPDSITAFRAFISACENGGSLTTADEILNALGIIPEPDANQAGKIFVPAVVQSDQVRYELSFTDDEIDELTIKAYPRR